MKKILLSFLMLFAIGSFAVNAETVTINPSDQTWDAVTDETYGDGYEATYGDIFIGTYKASGTANIRDPHGDGHFRHYQRSVIYLYSVSGKSITEVDIAVMQEGSGGITINDESVSVVDGTAQWTGSASNISIVVGNGSQYRYSSITVVTDDGGSTTVSAPRFSVSGGTYYTAQTVSITAAEGADIYYTTNGEDPTTSSTAYTEPIEITMTTTLKAIAVLDGTESSVAEATYTIAETTEVATIADFLALEDGTIATITSDVRVFMSYGTRTYIIDATGSIMVYGTIGIDFVNGDVIAGGFVGERDNYNGIDQLNITNTNTASTFTNAGFDEEVEPTVYTLDQITTETVNEFVKISNVTITTDASGDYTDYYANSGDVTPVQLYTFNYDQWSWDDFAALDLDKSYDVTGAVTVYGQNQTLEIYVINVEEHQTVGVGNVAAEEGAKAIGGNGEIVIVGEASNVEVYNIAGALVEEGNLTNIPCATGIYVVKVDGKAQKVIVK